MKSKLFRYLTICTSLCVGMIFGACTTESPVNGTDAAITEVTATVEGTKYEGYISGKNIEVLIPKNADWQNLQVSIIVSEGAKLSPSVKDVEDWSSEREFHVISANGQKEAKYIISVRKEEGDTFDTIVMLTNNSAMEAFAENGYSTVGALYIRDDGGNDPIISTAVLGGIKEIKTELEIQAARLEEIKFQSLESAGNIDVLSLNLVSASFPSLKDVAGRFRIGNDDSGPLPDEHLQLESVNAPKLENIGRSFKIFFCPNVTEIETPSLKYVGENIYLSGKFTDLSMIANLTELNGSLTLASPALEDLSGFSFRHISSSLLINGGCFASLEPLSCLESVNYIKVNGSEKLTSFKGLENAVCNALDIVNFANVTSTEFLPIRDGLEHLSLSNLPKLETLENLSVLKTINSLNLILCEKVSNLDVLSGLTEVNRLSIVRMEGLKKLPDFKNLTAVSGQLTISMMRDLQDISGLSNIREVGSLQIDNLLTIPSLHGLEGLEKITGGSLIIGNCKEITDLDPLQNLKEISFASQTDMIGITMNDKLTSYCAVKDLLVANWKNPSGKGDRVTIAQNGYNPTYEQLLNGECTPQ